jgi:DNA-3-methyladenine glycosylase II
MTKLEHLSKSADARDLAEWLSDGRLDEDALAVSGIGPWTAQGVLLVALRREDVVLPGDLALRKAIRDVYQLDRLPTEQEVLAIAEKWLPFRSLATSYLFASATESNHG